MTPDAPPRPSPNPARRAKFLQKLAALRDAIDKHHASASAIVDELSQLVSSAPTDAELAKRVIATFARAWATRYPGERYVFAGAKEVAQAKRFLKVLTVDEVEDRIARYMTLDDPFYERNGHTFGLFVSAINTVVTTHVGHGNEPLTVTCKHTPRCTSDVVHTSRLLQHR